MHTVHNWAFWALLSAVFATLTAIFAKTGIQDIDSDLATLVRTAVVIVALTGFVWFAGKATIHSGLDGYCHDCERRDTTCKFENFHGPTTPSRETDLIV